jgi:predicted transcriptional regulator of viral defense system
LLRTLIEDGILREIDLSATYPFEVKRYHLRAFSEYELALSLKPGAYLSHGTAAQLHELMDHDPTTIYLNKEQSPKRSKASLTQAGIDQAFAGKQRTSAYAVTHQQTKIVLLSGKHSDRLGVTKITGSQAEQLELTDLERTLIDVAVRPTYAGGTKVVARAYRNALPLISISRLVKMLQDLNYVYPYHQVVGFYLQNAGCPLSALQPLRDPGLHFDFYLEHDMKRTRFDSTWRLHVPEDLSSAR